MGFAIFRSPSESTQVQAATRELATELRRERAQAVLSSSARVVEFSRAGYRSSDVVHVLPAGMSLSLPQSSDPAGSGGITFYPDGSSSGIALRLWLGAASRGVAVGALTGSVTADP